MKYLDIVSKYENRRYMELPPERTCPCGPHDMLDASSYLSTLSDAAYLCLQLDALAHAYVRIISFSISGHEAQPRQRTSDDASCPAGDEGAQQTDSANRIQASRHDAVR